MVATTVNKAVVRHVNSRVVRSAVIRSFKTDTRVVLSLATGLSYSDIVIDAIVDRDRVYLLSKQKLSIINRLTKEPIGVVFRPKPNLEFTCLAKGRSRMYVGSTGGVYSLPIGVNQVAQNEYFKHLYYSEELGGLSVYSLHWRSLFGIDFLLVAHENGLTMVRNDNDFTRQLPAPDTDSGKVFMTTGGTSYYQNRTSGLFVVGEVPSNHEIYLNTPRVDYQYTTSSVPALASIDFKDIAVTEGTTSGGYGNTVFCVTTSGVSIISENKERFDLSTVKEVSLSNIVALTVSEGATATSGIMHVVSSDGNFMDYDLSSDQIVNTVSAITEPLFEADAFTVIEEI